MAVKYFVIRNSHCMELTPDETDAMFDPFDPLDQNLPFYLHVQRHRYIKPTVFDWLQQHVGDVDHQQWYSESNSSGTRTLLFRTAGAAMAFKLAWQL